MSSRRAMHGGVLSALQALLAAILLVALAASVSACKPKQSMFQIVDYRASGEPVQYHEVFDEAYYHVAADGNLELVLRRSEPSDADPREMITQVLYIRSVWRSIPGRTTASRTQINATISYLIVGGRVGASFEGAGSVFFKENRKQDELTGEVEFALLSPTRRLAGGEAIFERAQIEGRFRAIKDRRRVLRMRHEMDRLFGPLPPFLGRMSNVKGPRSAGT